MSKYSRQQEQRVWDYLKEHPDIREITYYGSRELNKGDFLFWLGNYPISTLQDSPGKLIRLDHKSTTNDMQVRLQKSWLEKLVRECFQQQDKVGISLPIISFSLKGCQTLYALSYSRYKEVSLYKTGKKSCVVRYRELNRWVKGGGGCIAIDFDMPPNQILYSLLDNDRHRKTVYIYTLDSLIKCIKES